MTSHLPCVTRGGKGQIQVAAAAPAQPGQAPSPPAVDKCPEAISVRNAAGQDVRFGLRKMVSDAGGIAQAREVVLKKIIDAQDDALNDSLPADQRSRAKTFAVALQQVRDQIKLCE